MFLRDTASQRVRDVRAFQDAVITPSLRQGSSFDGEMSQLSELADAVCDRNPELYVPTGLAFGVQELLFEDLGSPELAVEMGVEDERAVRKNPKCRDCSNLEFVISTTAINRGCIQAQQNVAAVTKTTRQHRGDLISEVEWQAGVEHGRGGDPLPAKQ